MKKITTTISAIFLCIGLNAQKIDRQADVEINFYPSNVEKYEVKVINSPNITKKISAKYQQQAEALASENRGAFFSGLLSITETAAFGVLGQSTSTLASATFSTITSAIKNKKQNQKYNIFYSKKIMITEEEEEHKSKYKIEFLREKYSKNLKTYKIIILGRCGVGKKSILHRLT